MTRETTDLFVDELKDMYDAEQQLVKALETMASKASDPKLAEAFREHRQQTRGQIDRIEQVFRLLERKPSKQTCEGVKGLVKEYTGFAKRRPAPEKLDAFSVGAALKVEHYEIAAYTTLIELAGTAGVPEAAALLGESLAEERATAGKLEALSGRMLALLAGEQPGGAITQTAEAVGERLRQGAMVAVGAADVARERTSGVVADIGDAAGRILGESEKRGRKIVRSASSSTSRSRSSSAKRKTATKAKASGAKGAVRTSTRPSGRTRGAASGTRKASTRKASTRKGSARKRSS